MAARKLLDNVTIASNATRTVTVSVNDMQWAVVELVNDQTCDLNLAGSVEDGAARVPTLTNEANLSYTRTGLTATANGRAFITPLRRCLSTLAIQVTNRSGGADAHVSLWLALSERD